MHGSPKQTAPIPSVQVSGSIELKRMKRNGEVFLPKQGKFIPVAVGSAPTMLVTGDMAKVTHR
jgi:hypothetical protein